MQFWEVQVGESLRVLRTRTGTASRATRLVLRKRRAYRHVERGVLLALWRLLLLLVLLLRHKLLRVAVPGGHAGSLRRRTTEARYLR